MAEQQIWELDKEKAQAQAQTEEGDEEVVRCGARAWDGNGVDGVF